MLAIAAGAEYAALLHERIFAPLQMTSSTVAVKGGTAARGRTKSGLGRQPWVLDGYAPAGGVISTIEDVTRLTAALVDGIRAGDRVVAAAATMSRRPRPGARRACSGSSSRSTPTHDREPDGATPTTGTVLTWHNGMTGGYSAFLGVARERAPGRRRPR